MTTTLLEARTADPTKRARKRIVQDAGRASKPVRGWARQRQHRTLERGVKSAVVAFLRWIRNVGLRVVQATKKIGLCVRTATSWRTRWKRDRLKLRPRGRPVARASREERAAVLASIERLGPGVGVAVLQGLHPTVARAELTWILARSRRLWRKRHRKAQQVLVWKKPSRVWSMDFTDPNAPVDAGTSSVLAVRDLGSGKVLWSTPHEHADHEATLVAVGTLFARHGAPLVMKSDNGSHFTAEAVQAKLRAEGVLHLKSPPYFPSYNGSIEAGIGSLKGHADYAAYRAGRPGTWSAEDMQEARCIANETARPWGAHGPTPAQAWSARELITEEERRAFQADYQKQEALARRELGHEENVVLDRAQQNAVDRIAIPRTLVEHRVLEYQRRVITPPIKFRK